MKGNLLGSLFIFCVISLILWGWCANIYKLANLDFASPYKAEIFRIAGVPVWPMGIVLGFVDFAEEEE